MVLDTEHDRLTLLEVGLDRPGALRLSILVRLEALLARPHTLSSSNTIGLGLSESIS